MHNDIEGESFCFCTIHNDDLDNGDFIDDFRANKGYKSTGVGDFIS